MPLSPQDALIYLMVIAASSDSSMNEVELQRIETLVGQLPVFDSSDRAGLSRVANNCVDLINSSADIEGVLDLAIGAIPSRLQDTAYALVVEIAAADLTLPQEELRFLEMLRDKLDLDGQSEILDGKETHEERVARAVKTLAKKSG